MQGGGDQPEWYLSRNGQQHGPISGAELGQLVQQRRIAPSDLVWRTGWPDWYLARDVPGLIPPPPQAAAPPPLPARQTVPPHQMGASSPAAAAQPFGLSEPAAQPAGAGNAPVVTAQHIVVQAGDGSNSFKFSTFIYLVLGLFVPLWPISLPLLWYLAYKSYKKPHAA